MSIFLFCCFVLLLAGQRVWELRISQRNIAELKKRGGREFYPEHYPVMVALHSSWLVAMVVEVVWLQAPFLSALFWPALGLVLVGQTLRYHAITTLGVHWNTRIVLVPETPPVRRGLYRFLRHPNYLGVALEILAVPLLHSAWVTALVFTVGNAALLKYRIEKEEAALQEFCGYREAFGRGKRPTSKGDK
jgi:methyltransferase